MTQRTEAIVIQDERIAELEDALKQRDRRIAELTAELDNEQTRVAEMGEYVTVARDMIDRSKDSFDMELDDKVLGVR